MANPEKQNLITVVNGKNQSTEVRINPCCFSVNALREIMRFQIFNAIPTEIIIIITKGKSAVISQQNLKNARNLFGNDRKRFLDVISQIMHDAEKIIIRNATQK